MSVPWSAELVSSDRGLPSSTWSDVGTAQRHCPLGSATLKGGSDGGEGMVGSSLRLGLAIVDLTGRTVVDVATVARPVVKIPPRALRQGLLTFQSSIQGRIPEILGDDEDERIDTLVALLADTSEEDLNAVISAAVEALNRLEDTGHRHARGRRPGRRRHEERWSAT